LIRLRGRRPGLLITAEGPSQSGADHEARDDEKRTDPDRHAHRDDLARQAESTSVALRANRLPPRRTALRLNPVFVACVVVLLRSWNGLSAAMAAD
jgi:hypothetical protein